jgi:uncharacterized glyoxalase superfamily protein PhnB
MAVKAVPDGISTITPQLSLEGAAEAIDFYKQALGAEELMRAPDPSGKKIWHAMMRIGTSSVFLNDTFPEMGGKPQAASLWIYAARVDALFERARAAGMTVIMPLADMFWGDRMGKLRDRWGVDWTLAEHVKDLSPAELQAAQDAFVASMK